MTRGVARFFDFEKKKKECGNCFKVLPLARFKRQTETNADHTRSSYYRSQCAPCYSEGVAGRKRDQNIETRPEMFWECEHCDFIQSEFYKKYCVKCKKERP